MLDELSDDGCLYLVFDFALDRPAKALGWLVLKAFTLGRYPAAGGSPVGQRIVGYLTLAAIFASLAVAFGAA